MCNFTDSHVATLSPKELKLGEIWRLFFEKNRGFSPEIWIRDTFLRFFVSKKDCLGHGLGPGIIVQRFP
jgi:hypothetical protein